jgi:hypothetical protein
VVGPTDYMGTMSGVLAIFVVLGMLATLGVLFFGLFTMARGGEFNARHSNKLMRWRVLLQGATLIVFVILMLVAGRH